MTIADYKKYVRGPGESDGLHMSRKDWYASNKGKGKSKNTALERMKEVRDRVSKVKGF